MTTEVDPSLATPLGQANEQFHDAYGAARSGAEQDAPVIVLLGDELILFRNGRRSSYSVESGAYHAAKAVAHVAVGLFAALYDADEGSLSADARARVVKLHRAVEEATAATAAAGDELSRTLAPLLSVSRDLAERASREGRVPRIDLEAFAHDAGPKLYALTQEATRVALGKLHARVEEALADLDGNARGLLQVVVAGDHQARARSLGMQYFQRRFCEPEGADERVTFGENVTTAEEALALVGTRRLDRVIARAFFGDPKRLQRDVLGDAAKAQLDELDLEPIEPVSPTSKSRRA